MANIFSGIGPCSLNWENKTGGTALGKTLGEVKVKMTQNFAEIKNDQDGAGPVDGIITGLAVEVVTPLSEATVAILAEILASATLTALTGQAGKFSALGGVGTQMYANAAPLILVRYVDGIESTDQDDHMEFLKAYPVIDAELAFGPEGQRVVNVTWKCFPSQATGDVGVYFRVGDPSS